MLQDNKKYIETARVNLEEKALKYARMKLFGEYFDDKSNRISPFPTDVPDLVKICSQDLLEAAELLLKEMASTPLPERSESV